MKKIKELFNKRAIKDIAIIGTLSLMLVVGFTVGNYHPTEYADASGKNATEASEQKNTDKKAKTESEATLSSIFGKESSSKSSSAVSSKSSKASSTVSSKSSKASSTKASSTKSSSKSSSSKKSSSKSSCKHDDYYYYVTGVCKKCGAKNPGPDQSSCKHQWSYSSDGDYCDKCYATRTHTHQWVQVVTPDVCREQYDVNICHDCLTHYDIMKSWGCPNCGSASYAQGTDCLYENWAYNKCSTCGKYEDIGWTGEGRYWDRCSI